MDLNGGRFVINFDSGRAAFALRAPLNGNPEEILNTLHLEPPQPVMIILGGATEMAADQESTTRPFFEVGMAHFVQKHQIAMIDGGTHSGVMKMIGMTRIKLSFRFPLVGVAPLGVIDYPGYENPKSLAELDSGHSHFVLVEGDEFGDEGLTMARLVHALSGYGKQPVLGVVINGGAITREEVHRFATVPEFQIPLLVLQGSGRFADTLAEAVMSRDPGGDEKLKEILDKGNVRRVSVKGGPKPLVEFLKQHYSVS